MNLNLKRPLAFFDLETTGVDVATSRIVEYSILKIFPDGRKDSRTQLINPGIPIPFESSEIHKIFDDDVKDAPLFKNIAGELKSFLNDSDLAGYNSNKFDIPLLVEEFLRAGIEFEIKGRKLIDVQNIFHQMEQRTLAAAYKFYCDKEIKNAHSAEADILATYEVFEAQIKKYENVEFTDKKGKKYIPVVNDMEALHDFSYVTNSADLAGRIVYNEKGHEVFNFGKHKGRSVEEILKLEPGYYSWMMNGDFPLYTKKVLTAIKLRAINQK